MFEPVRGGTRGGQAEFKWSDVSADKDREHYLGHSINAPTGRWQKNKDVHWYNRDKNGDTSEQEEIRKIKELEAEALSVALGYGPTKKAPVAASPTATSPRAPTSSPTQALSPTAKAKTASDPDMKAIEKAEKRRRKEAKREEKRARKERKRLDRDRTPSRSRSSPPRRGYRELDRERSRSPRRRSRSRNRSRSREERDARSGPHRNDGHGTQRYRDYKRDRIEEDNERGRRKWEDSLPRGKRD